MMISYRSRFLKWGEVWFDNDPDPNPQGVDCILYHQRSQPVPGSRARSFYTRLIDLSRTEEQLVGQLNEDTAYKIRRARERDGIRCECHDPLAPAVLDDFERMFNSFAALKGLPRLGRSRMESLAAAGLLDISVAKDSQGNPLVYHANYRDRSRAMQLELPSLYRSLPNSSARNFSGRASRYLTWSDILRFKREGLSYFDFGGWHPGNDPELLSINDFKRGFGGQVVRQFECEQILTLKGWIALNVTRLLSQSKPVSSVAMEPAEGAETGLPYVPSISR